MTRTKKRPAWAQFQLGEEVTVLGGNGRPDRVEFVRFISRLYVETSGRYRSPWGASKWHHSGRPYAPEGERRGHRIEATTSAHKAYLARNKLVDAIRGWAHGPIETSKLEKLEMVWAIVEGEL